MAIPLTTNVVTNQAGHPGLHNEEREAINAFWVAAPIPGSASSSFDSLTDPATYQVTGTHPALPGVIGGVGSAFLRVTRNTTGTTIVQTVTGIESGVISTRVSYNGTWGAWRSLTPALASWDSGPRNIANLLVNSWAGGARLRRIGANVELSLTSLSGGSSEVALTLPTGFRPAVATRVPVLVGDATTLGMVTVHPTGNLNIPVGQAAGVVGWTVRFVTSDAIPSTLPGTAI